MSSVSVIIPAYNQGHYLKACVQSVLNQTFKHFNIFIVDDGSTDNTREVANSFSDLRVHYIYQQNRGLSAARNTGTRHAQGTYLSYLDSDDLFLPNKLELLVNKLETEPGLGLVAGQAILIDENGKEIGDVFDAPPPEDAADLLLGNPFHVGSILIHRKWQERVGYFDENLRSYEDWDMWLRLAIAGCKMGWVNKPVSLYRFHSGQMTRDGDQMTRATFAVLEKIYQSLDIPNDWLKNKNLAYSNAYLRATPQAYRDRNFQKAKHYITKAVEFNPNLKPDELAKRIAGWVDYAKTDNPLQYIIDIYDNLPNHFSELKQRKNGDIAQKAIEIAFQTYERGDYKNTRSALFIGLRYSPNFLTNRGVRAILINSLFSTKSFSR